jgi:ABC-type nickel/cobalt efflux system permease component RcnA
MTGRWRLRLGALVAGVLAAVAGSLAVAPAASAHPLGNFTVNQYSGLRVQPGGVAVDYVLDMAEIPAFQTRTQDIDADRDGVVSPAEQDRWAAAACRRLSSQVTITVDQAAAPVTVVRAELAFPSGAAGLVTLRLDCSLHATAAVDRPLRLSYRDGAYPDRVGWREVTATGDGTTLTSSTVPVISTSGRLTAYPANLLAAPLDVRGAEIEVRPGGSRVAAGPAEAGPRAPLARGVDRATSAFTSLVGHRRLTVAFGLVAVLLSVLLGALHALAPGHGKTVMAAFLVGGRGSLRQALTVGLTVTVTHTLGVLVLGAVLTTSVALAPQRLYPWLGVASGVLLAGLGMALFRRARAGAPDHGHSHRHPHAHGHADRHRRPDQYGHVHEDGRAGLVLAGASARTEAERFGPFGFTAPAHVRRAGDPAHHDDHAPLPHPHAHPHRHGRPTERGLSAGGGGAPWIRRRALLAMGFAGGLVPSPSALVVLLGAVGLGRTWFGILLVIGYGAGMAAALMGIGLLLAGGRRFLERRSLHPRALAVAARLPVLTAALILGVGLGLAGQAAVALLAA